MGFLADWFSVSGRSAALVESGVSVSKFCVVFSAAAGSVASADGESPGLKRGLKPMGFLAGGVFAGSSGWEAVIPASSVLACCCPMFSSVDATAPPINFCLPGGTSAGGVSDGVFGSMAFVTPDLKRGLNPTGFETVGG